MVNMPTKLNIPLLFLAFLANDVVILSPSAAKIATPFLAFSAAVLGCWADLADVDLSSK